MQQTLQAAQPSLLLGDRSEATLRCIVRSAMKHAPEVAQRLLNEVDRANIVIESEVPEDAVALGSFVTYQIRRTGAINTIRLVAPHEANLSQMRVSVISDVGAALVGLRPGQEIEWEFGGHHHVLQVLRVARQL